MTMRAEEIVLSVPEGRTMRPLNPRSKQLGGEE